MAFATAGTGYPHVNAQAFVFQNVNFFQSTFPLRCQMLILKFQLQKAHFDSLKWNQMHT